MISYIVKIFENDYQIIYNKCRKDKILLWILSNIYVNHLNFIGDIWNGEYK